MGKHSCCVKQKLRKGLWSPEEDEKLFNHMTRYGTNGCWSSVPKLAGLQRCGKSCRLRWLNYLRPNLKRGTFSPDEEDIILNLHKIIGNRWAQIAAQLPGRTDNEIKNFWNSYLKKKLMKQGIDPATHKPLADVNKDEKAEESILASEELRTRVSSLRAYEPTFLIDDAFSENNIGLVDHSTTMTNGSGSGCSLPFPECHAGIEMDVYNPSLMMDQYHSNSRSIFNYQNHNPAAELSPGIGFSCMPSLMNFEIDATSKECSSNKISNISSYSSGFQANDASECDQAFNNCFLQFQVKSEDEVVPDSWLLEEHLMNNDVQSPVNISSYQLTSISEDHMKAGGFRLFDQL